MDTSRHRKANRSIMGGGRQLHNRSRPQVARNNMITPQHHHAHLRSSSSAKVIRPRSLSDYRKGGERLRARQEIWAARKYVQLNKDKEKEKEEVENSAVAKLLLHEPPSPYRLCFGPVTVLPQVSGLFKNPLNIKYQQLYRSAMVGLMKIESTYSLAKSFDYPVIHHNYKYPHALIKLDDLSDFDDSSSEQSSDAMDELIVDDDSVDPTPYSVNSSVY